MLGKMSRMNQLPQHFKALYKSPTLVSPRPAKLRCIEKGSRKESRNTNSIHTAETITIPSDRICRQTQQLLPLKLTIACCQRDTFHWPPLLCTHQEEIMKSWESRSTSRVTVAVGGPGSGPVCCHWPETLHSLTALPSGYVPAYTCQTLSPASTAIC